MKSNHNPAIAALFSENPAIGFADAARQLNISELEVVSAMAETLVAWYPPAKGIEALLSELASWGP